MELECLYFTSLPQTCSLFNILPKNSTSCPSIQELGKIWHCVKPFLWPLVQTRVMVSFLNFHNKIAALTYLHVYLKHVVSTQHFSVPVLNVCEVLCLTLVRSLRNLYSWTILTLFPVEMSSLNFVGCHAHDFYRRLF